MIAVNLPCDLICCARNMASQMNFNKILAAIIFLTTFFLNLHAFRFDSISFASEIMSANPTPFSISIQVEATQLVQTQVKDDAAPILFEAAPQEELLELTTPTLTAEDIAWESRLAYFPHLHRWIT